MGRASAGRGGGGGSRSSSHSSSSRSHSSSRSYSSSSGRASRGSSSFSSNRSSGSHAPGGNYYSRPSVHYHNHYGGYGGFGGGYSRRHVGFTGTLVALVITFLIVAVMMASLFSVTRGSIPASTVNREKLDLGYGYRNDNIVDELDWIKNPSRLSRDLKEFYNKTGVQPYIMLVDYISGVTGRDDTEVEWAEDKFDELVAHGTMNEGCMLLVYFDDGDDYNSEDGASQLILGRQTESVMDAEAVDIFWAYYNQHFFSNEDEDTMFRGMFMDTADRIMQKTTTGNDVMKNVVIAFIVISVIAGVLIIMKVRRKHEAQRAAETERILSTPLNDGGSGDPLLDQYSNHDEQS